MKKSIAVDVDGVLAQYDEWRGLDHIGDPIPGAVEFTKKLGERFDVIIFTTRCSEEVNGEVDKAPLLVNRVRCWLDKHGFEYDHIWSEKGKPLCLAFIDDRGIRCEPQKADDPNDVYNATLAFALTQIDLK